MNGGDAPAGGPGYRASLSRPSVWLSLLLFFLYVGAETTAGQWSFTLLHDSRGVAAPVASAWISVYWACLTLGRLMVGVVVDRLGAETVLRLSLAGLAAAGVLLWQPETAVGLLGLALAGLSAAPVYPLLMASTPARVGRAHATNAVGFQVAAGSIGLAALPAVTGLAASRLSLEAIPPAFWLQAMLLLAVFEIAIRRQRRRQSPTAR